MPHGGLELADYRVCAEPGCEQECAPRKQRCHECWLNAQPPVVRIEAAKRRLALVPEELRVDRVPAGKWPDGRRWCAGCQTFVRLADCGGQTRCRACTSIARHLGSLRNDYGIDPATYTHLFEMQGGRCAICRGRPQSKRLAVDHNHACCPIGKRPLCGRCTRGLLCSRCNHDLLGAAHDSVQVLKNAVAYMERPPFSGDWALPPLEEKDNLARYGTRSGPSF